MKAASQSAASAGLTRRATEGDRGPRKSTVEYAEEADGVQHSQAGACGDAVEDLCIIRAIKSRSDIVG